MLAFGQAVHYGKDYNNDGVADFVVGAPKWDAPKQPSLKPRKDTGAVYLISKDAAVIKMLQGQFAKDEFGSAIAFADMNGDGVEELVVGAPKFSGAGLKFAGRVYVYGTATWNEIDQVDGDIANGLFGQSLLKLDTAEGAAAVVLVGAPQITTPTGLKRAGAVVEVKGGNKVTRGKTYYGEAAGALLGSLLAKRRPDR